MPHEIEDRRIVPGAPPTTGTASAAAAVASQVLLWHPSVAHPPSKTDVSIEYDRACHLAASLPLRLADCSDEIWGELQFHEAEKAAAAAAAELVVLLKQSEAMKGAHHSELHTTALAAAATAKALRDQQQRCVAAEVLAEVSEQQLQAKVDLEQQLRAKAAQAVVMLRDSQDEIEHARSTVATCALRTAVRRQDADELSRVVRQWYRAACGLTAPIAPEAEAVSMSNNATQKERWIAPRVAPPRIHTVQIRAHQP